MRRRYDFNGDHKPDLLVTTNGENGGYIELLLNKGDGTLQIPPSAVLLPNGTGSGFRLPML